MAKFRNYEINDENEVCALGRAFSSPIRLKILQLLYEDSLIIGDIARVMNIPASSAAFHLKILEEAGLIRMEDRPGARGSSKLCSRKIDSVSIRLIRKDENVREVFSSEMPVGMYSECEVVPTCGLVAADGVIGNEDLEYSFYLPERVNAGLLWSSAGYVEYKFANGLFSNDDVKRVCLTMEICSEAPGFREDWKSDITVWINGVDCGTWTSPGDFGHRRGRLTGSVWPNGSTQYGMLVNWEVRKDGCYVNDRRVGDVTVDELDLNAKSYVSVRIGNKPDAQYIGGFNIFGKDFGDYAQDIVLSMEC